MPSGSSNEPPQLQLSLGHPAFKRSFRQFGLDVDEASDTDGGGSSSSSGSSYSIGTSAGASASGSSQSGTGYYSSPHSQGSSGGSAYHDGHNERNKRARSNGPEGARLGDASGVESGNAVAGPSSISEVSRAGPPLLEIPGLLRDVEDIPGLSTSTTSMSVDTTSINDTVGPPPRRFGGDLMPMPSIWTNSSPNPHRPPVEHRSSQSTSDVSPPEHMHYQPSRFRRPYPPLSLRSGSQTTSGLGTRHESSAFLEFSDTTTDRGTVSIGTGATTGSSLFGDASTSLFSGSDSLERGPNTETVVRMDLEQDVTDLGDRSRGSGTRVTQQSTPTQRESSLEPSRINLPTLRSALLNLQESEDEEMSSAHDLEEIFNRVRRLRENQRRSGEDRYMSATELLRRDVERRDLEDSFNRSFDMEESSRARRLPRLQEEPSEASSSWPSFISSSDVLSNQHQPLRVSEDQTNRDSFEEYLSGLWEGDSSSTSDFVRATSPLSQLMVLPPLEVTRTSSPPLLHIEREHRSTSPLRGINDLNRTGSDGRLSQESSWLQDQPDGLARSFLNRLFNNEEDTERGSQESNHDMSISTELPSLSELRERYRLPVRRRSYLERTSSPSVSDRREPEAQSALSSSGASSRWRHSFHPASSVQQVSIDVESSGPLPVQLSLNLHTHSHSFSDSSLGSANANANAARSSSEAAAYFASGTRQGHSSNTTDGFRHRNRPFDSLGAFDDPIYENRLAGLNNARRSMLEASSPYLPPSENVLPRRISDSVSTNFTEHHEHRHSTSELQNVYGRQRPLPVWRTYRRDGSEMSPSQHVHQAASRARPLSMVEPSSSSRVRFPTPATPSSSGLQSEPPSLPPLQFDRLSSLVSDQQPASESISAHGPVWRRIGGSMDRNAYSSLSSSDHTPASTTQNTHNTNSNETPASATNYYQDPYNSEGTRIPVGSERENATATSAAASSTTTRPAMATATGEPGWRFPPPSQGFHRAMLVLEVDGLSAQRRQQFTNVYERERERERDRERERERERQRERTLDRARAWTSSSRPHGLSLALPLPPPPPPPPPAPRDSLQAHERWGDIPVSSGNLSPSRSMENPWDAPRRHRRPMSALFAPPPENADNARPRSNMYGGGMYGHRHHGGAFDSFDAGVGLGNELGGSGSGSSELSTGASASAGDSANSGSGSGSTSGSSRPGGARRFIRERANSVRQFAFRLGRNRAGLHNLGDFIRDEDFDTSYESLLALSATLGEVKPKATPANVIAALPTALYKEWQSAEADKRCPICLDDYQEADPVLKSNPCNHWLHKECLTHWLQSARTCPVCRATVEAPPSSSTSFKACSRSTAASPPTSPTSVSSSSSFRSPSHLSRYMASFGSSSSSAGSSSSSSANAGSSSSGSGLSISMTSPSSTSTPSLRSRVHSRTRSLSRAIRPLHMFSEEEDSMF